MEAKTMEHLYPMDKVIYDKKYYFVSTAHYVAVDGMQVVSLIRVADMESNRNKRSSIKIRADECKIIIDSPIRNDIKKGKEPKVIYTEKDYE